MYMYMYNIMQVGSLVFKETDGVPMGAVCAPLIVDLFSLFF